MSQHDDPGRADESTRQVDGHVAQADEHTDESTDGRFSDGPISRRTFVRLSAATGAALALPGNATASASSAKMDAEYRYIINHTPADYSAPTLVTFSDETGPDAMASALSTEVITTTEPRPAAYAKLTTAQAEAVADLPDAENLSFSPGSNPFWRIGYYPLGVFPEARRSVDFISYEQLKDGLTELEERQPDMLRVKRVGESPGHYNNLTTRRDPKGMYVAEVTNFRDEDDPDPDNAAFEDKEKVFFSLSLHGLERAGAEAGARIIENILRGDQYAGKIPDLLNDVVILFGFTNPDGWVVRNPQYDSGWQTGGPGGAHPRIPAAPLYERGNAAIYDTNRQYPTVGYITTDHYPAAPDRGDGRSANGYENPVSDAAAIVEHFQTYENLNYGADLHGGPVFNEFVLGLVSQDQYDTREVHEVYEFCLNIDEQLEEALAIWHTAGQLKLRLVGERETGILFGVLPEESFDYSTIYDTIGYTVSGAMLDWMAHPVELGGLGMTTLDFEMSFSHIIGGNVYNPELLRMEVLGYRTAIRTITRFAVKNSDTPNTEDEFDVDTQTGGESVAYVTTGTVGDPDEDLLARTSEGLNFQPTEEVDSRTFTGTIGPGTFLAPTTAEETFDTAKIDDRATRLDAELSWTPPGQDLEFYLENPDGERIAGAATASNPETLTANLTQEGTYTFVATTYANVAAQYEIKASFIGPVEGDGSGSSGSTDTTGTTSASATTNATSTNVAVTSGEVGGTDHTTLSQTVESGLHSMTVHTHAHDAVLDLELVSPSGEVVRSFDAVTDERVGGKCCGFPEWHVGRPAGGEWTVRATNRLETPTLLDVQFGTLASQSVNPNPEEALGYEQQSYSVTPFQFFEDYGEYVRDGGSVEAVTNDEVAAGALAEYDHAVVIHDFKGDSPKAYTDALDSFVDAGGNLVLTDTGTRLLSTLDNDLVDGAAFAAEDAIIRNFYDVARYFEKNLDHPLLTDARPIQNQLWKVAPLGYAVSSEAPMYLVDSGAFEESARGVASVAGTTSGRVATASVTPAPDEGRGIHVISSLLPPASQSNLHPFGLLDYTTSFLGYLVLTSALGFQQVRTSGETRRVYGRGDKWAVDGGGGGASSSFAADGSRSDDGSSFTAGQTNQVDVTVERLSAEATIRDTFPPEWEFIEGFSDGTADQEQGVVEFGTVGPVEEGDDPVTFTYFVEAPSSTGGYQFGPAEATATVNGEDVTKEFTGTETNYVVGQSTNV